MLASATMAVRVDGDPGAMVGPVSAVLRAVRADVPLFDPGTFRDAFNSVLAPQRMGATLFSLFGMLALLTAAIGLYGMLAHVLSFRMREFGVRTALGARPGDLTRLMLRYGLGRVAAGLAAGLVLAQLAAGAARQFLWGTSSYDLGALLLPALVLGTAGLAASLGPARRAARADPMESLRSD
jgi:ABC-type antimicrobial peptide transport system permease subunit